MDKSVFKIDSQFRRIFSMALFANILIGCGYYPRNQAAIALSNNKSQTFTVSIIPTNIKKQEVDFELIKTESLITVTKNLKKNNIFISPSFFTFGVGSGIGYIFETKTVLSGFLGVSFIPESYASGFSLSQGISKYLFIDYKLNYSKLHYQNCVWSCYESNNGKLVTFHTVNMATKLEPFYAELNIGGTRFHKEYLFYGVSIGFQGDLK